jgi:hypothetical protein
MYTAAAENIAYSQKTPEDVVDKWMNSAGHRANILSTELNQIGVGVYEYNGVMYWVQLFIYSTVLANSYTVTFNANGGDGIMDEQAVVYGRDAILSTNTFTRVGHDFVGWNTAADGSGSTYADNHAFTPWRRVYNLSLYAVWQADDDHCHNHTFEAVPTAACWIGGWDMGICSTCGEAEVNEAGKPVTYGWRGALGHDYKLIERTIANCWAGGGDFVECRRCGYENLINWHGALGHLFGAPEPTYKPLWNIVHCERDACGYSKYQQAR